LNRLENQSQLNWNEMKIANKNAMYEPSAYYYYTTASKKTGMSQYGVFTRDKSRWLKFWGFEAERMDTEKIRPYGASRAGIFTRAEDEKPTKTIQYI
jgi:hypothetical protein